MSQNKGSIKRYQSGQSMVEYTVILIAMSTALYTVTTSEFGHVGTQKLEVTDPNFEKYNRSLLQAMHNRYEAQSFGLRISELPERNFDEITGYYDRLEKFPTLSSEIGQVSSNLNKLNQNLNDVNDGISTLNTLKESAESGMKSVKDSVTDALDIF